MRKSLSFLAVAALALFLSGCAGVGLTHPAAPPLERPIVDTTGTLTATQIDDIASVINSGRATSGRQTAVLVVKTTGKESLEGYSLATARDWGVGVKDLDNGILLLVAVDDRKLRIEVGRGLEGDIPDATARHIADDIMGPLLKKNDLYGAVKAGAAAVQSGADRSAAAAPQDGGFWKSPIGIVVFLVLAAAGAGSKLRRGGGGGSSFGGGGFSGGGSSSSY